MKRNSTALKEAKEKLCHVRAQAKALRKEIGQLRQVIISAGGNPDEPKIDLKPRNKEIYKGWKDGQNFKQLGEEYKMSSARISQICNRIERILESKQARYYKTYKDLLPYK